MLFCDSHNDFLSYKTTYEEVLDYLKVEIIPAEVKAVLSAVYTTELSDKDPLNLVKSRFELARKVSDRFICTVEDCFFLTPQNLEAFIALKPFCCALTWNNANSLAGGALSEGGLTDWGRTVVKELEQNGIKVDCAHLNRKSFFQLADITTSPLFNSHTCLDSVFCHPRNITDEQAKLIVNSDGFVGITFVNSFYKHEGAINSSDIAAQLDCFVDKFGASNVGIGTDFFGIEQYPIDFKNYLQKNNLENQLLTHGFCREYIDNIFENNFAKLLVEW